ncbi:MULTISPECIES: DUF1192 domain-containing protein [unclassified Methylobacterium]|uniref:DUF1192 domain-containing protein n=1 Tax=unclassified Methylobacterium TaxID=2615210 RepID=UPI0011C922F8|nr:DUF1192 domain-containing protein [Methylobacterium sp. WL64]TXN04637.1 DUF1192 domain-containing protein [Methylobacterium sp. WL64]
MRDDDERPRKAVAHEIGQSLDTLSLSDLDARVALLREEIARIEAARATKQAAQGAADAFFKRG